MKLRQLRIHNYRSIKDLELEVPDMLVLVGPNNHGKSNILRAIEFGLSTSVKPHPEDFFLCRPQDDRDLWVEMTFDRLTEQEKTTFRKYLRHDDTIRIRKTARLQDDDNVDIQYNGYVQEPDQWWLKSSAFERLSNREQLEQEAQKVAQLRPLLETSGRITRQRVEDFQREYIEQHRHELSFTEVLESAPLLGQRNVGGGVLPEFFLIPAVRDLSEEIKVRTTTVFGRLLQRAVKEMAERDERFVEARMRLQRLLDDLNARPKGSEEPASELARLEETLASELNSWGVGVTIEVTPPELEKVFELGTRLHVDDGLKTPAERKGHGLQRAVMFALVRAWAKSLRPSVESETSAPRLSSDSVFFAIEEPELFLHPHAQRQLMASLADIAAAENHQVLISTHSTHFIDLEHYRRVAIVTKPSPEQGTQVKQCTRELFAGQDADDRKRRFHMAAWVNPDRGELFFARKVVLVEGEAEKAVLPFLASKLGCFDPNVSVIDCGGKYNLPLYIEILNTFAIPYLVIHDKDPLPDPIPDDWREEKRAAKRRTFQMNETIRNLVDASLGEVEMLEPDFETVAGIPKSQAEKEGKALAAVDHFERMNAEVVPERIAEVVRKAYGVRG